MGPVLACTDCLNALVALGARRIDAAREASLLDRCVAHESTHAMHLVDATADQLATVRADIRQALTAARIARGHLKPCDPALVARVAAQLLTGQTDPMPEDIRGTVALARSIVRAAEENEL